MYVVFGGGGGGGGGGGTQYEATCRLGVWEWGSMWLVGESSL